MNILCFSDLHRDVAAADALAAQAGAADLVIGAGDFATMRRGVEETLVPLSGIAAPSVLVPGNAESADELRAAAGETWPAAQVLHGGEAEIAGLRVFGLGYAVPVTPFGDWSCDLSEEEAEASLAACAAADVLVVHSPPHGVADLSSRGQRIGSTAIRMAIERLQPRLVVCGHVHDCWGVSGRIGESLVLNAGPVGVWATLTGDGGAVLGAALMDEGAPEGRGG